MFDFDFAYSGAMQVILFFASCITTLFFYAFTTDVVLTIYGEKISLLRRTLFIIIAGTVMNNFWTYGIYFIGGRLNFSSLTYNLVTVPNPVFALIFFFLGVRLLKLSPHSSVRLLTNTYLFIMVVKIFQRTVGYICFPQTGPQWNYFSDTISVIVCTLLYLAIYIVLKKRVLKSNYVIRLTDHPQLNPLWKEIIFLLLKTSLVYLFIVFYPLYVNASPNLYLVIMFIMLVLTLWINILNDGKLSSNMEIINKAVHVKILNETIDGFSGLKHDFNNILQTYGGYIATQNLDALSQYHQSVCESTVLLNESDMLNNTLAENPALISLLIQKYKLALTREIHMRINIVCDIRNLYIREMDLCRSVGNLLDNAIEAAYDSDKKWISFSIEQKPDQSKLIVIANSTQQYVDVTAAARAGTSTKKGHTGMGLNHTRRMLGQYPNCAFQVAYYNYEFTAYINISAVL